MPRPGLRLIVYLLGCFLLQSASAGGQTVNISTGAVEGRVIDATGAVLAGVAVTVSSDALMRPRQTLSDMEGFYRFPALPPGAYALAFARQGFAASHRDAVHISVGFTATIDVVMDLAAVEEQVTVEHRSPVVDKQSVAIATNFDAAELGNLPGARNMAAILAATPAVYLTRFDVGGNTAALGVENGAFGTTANNRPMVEGIDTTGVQGTGFTFDYGSFDEVFVTTAAHTTEWPKPGVQMQFIAKSGGNQYRGAVYADYENRAWQSFNIDEDQIARGVEQGGGLSERETNRLWGYHDVNADVGGFVTRDALWWYTSFRDQEVAARYINFWDRPHRARVTNYTGKATYQATPNHKLVAYGQAGRNHVPNRLDPSGLTGLTAASAIHESEESTADQRGWGWVVKGEWNAVVNNRLFVEVRAGQFGADLQQGSHSSDAARFEDTDTGTVRGSNRDFFSSMRRDQLFGSVSHFKDGWLGNHLFKGGGEVYRTLQADIWRSGYRGNVLHVVEDGVPRQVYLLETGSRSEAGFWAYGAYANDSWRMNDRVTLNLGLRVDRFQLFLPAQEHPAGLFNPTAQMFPAVENLIDWDLPAPRIGLIVDPAGDGQTSLKFSYSQYRSNPGTPTASNANPNSSLWWRRYTWSDLDGDGIWDDGEQGRQPIASRGGAKTEELDPGLELPFVRELAGWVERELPANVGVRAGFVWRGEWNHFQRQDVNQPFDSFIVPVRIPDPGPDGAFNTVDDGLGIDGYQLGPNRQVPVNILRNVPNAESNYWTFDITASKRFDGRWSLVSGFAHTWSHDQASGYFGQQVRQNVFPLTPNDLINAGTNGRYDFRIWSAKVHGTYQAPWELRITPLLRHQSGQPFGRSFSTTLNYGTFRVLAEPIGTRRMDNVTLVDLRVEKAVRLRFGRFALFVDVFNAFNANAEQNISWVSGEFFLQPLNIVAPRIARIGAKVEW
jgi:Carboxypeptidase regulatory-like domain/TonB dependent receptor-like, beta-barrel